MDNDNLDACFSRPYPGENDSVFSGVRAMPAREVAEELHGWQHGESADFALLVGAVTTLAREVDRITPVVIDHDSGPARDLAAQLALVYAGLREVRSMIATGWQQTERIADPLNRSLSRGGLLQAIDLRLAAMLEAGGDRID